MLIFQKAFEFLLIFPCFIISAVNNVVLLHKYGASLRNMVKPPEKFGAPTSECW